MHLTSPHLPERTPASRAVIETLIPALKGRDDPFAILDDGSEQTYTQVLWQPSGFILDYQEGSMDHHYRSIRDDLSEADIVAAFCGYLERNPSWRAGIEFQRIELRKPAFHVGRALGRFVGRIQRLLG